MILKKGLILVITYCPFSWLVVRGVRSSVELFYLRYHPQALQKQGLDFFFFWSPVWFDLVAYDDDDMLHSRHEGNPWLWDFMPPQLTIPIEGRHVKFQQARVQFDLHPTRFAEQLESFAEDLAIQDMAHAMIKFCTNPSHDFIRLRAWAIIRREVQNLAKHPESCSSDSPSISLLDEAGKFLESAKTNRTFLSTVNTEVIDIEAIEQTSELLNRFIKNFIPYENEGENRRNLLTLDDADDCPQLPKLGI